MTGINFFDAVVMTFIQKHFHNPVSDALFPVITYLGEAGAVWIALSLVLLCFRDFRKCGMLMLLAMLGAFLTGELLLKNLVCRPRPCQEFPNYVQMLVTPPTSFSFPSGHSASSLAASTVLLLHSKKLGIPACLLALLIAFSRIFLFVHYPTDVLAGMAFGVFFGVLTVGLWKKFSQKSSPTA